MLALEGVRGEKQPTNSTPGNSTSAKRHFSRSILGGDVLPFNVGRLPARHCLHQPDLWPSADAHRVARLLHRGNSRLRLLE
jgi:hypothetical protein